LYGRAYALYDMVTRHDKTYDLTRLAKMHTARQKMSFMPRKDGLFDA